MGDDLVLLAINDRKGVIRDRLLLTVALSAAELAELALDGCVGMDGPHLVATRARRSGEADPMLDACLKAVGRTSRQTAVTAWIVNGRSMSGSNSYVESLTAAGVLRTESLPRRLYDSGHRVHIVDRGRADEAVARFRAAAAGKAQAGIEDEVFALLADAARLTRVHVGWWKARSARRRLSGFAERRTQEEAEPDRIARSIVRLSVRTIKAVDASSRGSTNGLSIGIPIDQQYGMRNGFGPY